ncbi:MAG TPA: ABC transporter ATP-binding protein [Candidatus Methanoperedenaceae archaeon]|nr:ABC transporter ATP-binding protein [Candidatus Methanoperedenaceae archaeon]
MDRILETESVTKTYRLGKIDVPVLHGIDLSVKQGEFAAIMGPSGSGKSTLLNIIGCLDRPTSGRVLIDCIDTSTLSDNELAVIRGRKIGFVFQTFNLVARLSAQRNVEMPMIYQDVPRNARVKRARELLTLFGLSDRMDHKPPEMSGGQRQRVALARALANDPALILADEPTGNLDSKTGKEILRILEDLNERGRTILIVTHDHEIAGKCDRIIRLKDGVIET